MAPSIDKRVVLGLRDSIAALIPTGVLMVCVCTDWCSALAAAFLARLERNLKLRSMIAKKGTDLETDVESKIKEIGYREMRLSGPAEWG